MWELYDALIEKVPNDLIIDEVVCGCAWTMIRCGKNAGVSMTVNSRTRPSLSSGNFVGAPLKEAAALVKSWNLIEASIGLAAMNAYYNTTEKAKENGITLPGEPGYIESQNAFVACQDDFRGKNVCVVGHFPHLEKHVAPISNLSVLERNPQNGDFPDTACEYILPEQDYVFITGCTLINKTLPRLLELSKNAHVVLVGPSVTLSPLLFNYGADDLSGFIVTSPQICSHIVGSGDMMPIFNSGELVRMLK